MLTAVFFTVNQARLVAAAASMQVWGFRTGYERHVFLCTDAQQYRGGGRASTLCTAWGPDRQGLG